MHVGGIGVDKVAEGGSERSTTKQTTKQFHQETALGTPMFGGYIWGLGAKLYPFPGPGLIQLNATTAQYMTAAFTLPVRLNSSTSRNSRWQSMRE